MKYVKKKVSDTQHIAWFLHAETRVNAINPVKDGYQNRFVNAALTNGKLCVKSAKNGIRTDVSPGIIP